MSFHVGQRVVCVDDSMGIFPGCSLDLAGLCRGQIYTVRGLDTIKFPHFCAGWAVVLLEEIVRQPDPNGIGEVGFSRHRFRPVKTTSIEIFRQMFVTPPREVVDA